MGSFHQIARTSVGCAGAFVAVALAVATGPARADSAADFYKGKTIDLIIGLPPGGGYDSTGRLVASHIGAHIPGQPSVVPQNMPGASGLKAADYIYNSAPRDGTQFGIVTSSTLMEPLFGDKQARFDPSKFSWLGSASQEVHYCGISPRSHITSFDQWMKSGKELTFGAASPAGVTYQHPMVLKNVLHANLKVVAGYNGAADIALAVQRGEVDGMCADLSSLEARYKAMVDSGQLKLLIQMGPHKDNTFGKIPSVFDYVKTDEERRILSVLFDPLALGRPFMAPPGIPEDRHAALSAALQATLKDPALLADAKKMGVDIDYLSGEDAKIMLKKFAAYPPDVVQKAKLAMGSR